MAATIANLKRIPGQNDVWGGHAMQAFLYTGPTSYANPGGDEIDTIGTGGSHQTTIRSILMCNALITVSGNFWIKFQPLATTSVGLPNKVIARWFAVPGGAEVANGVNLSAETTILCLVGD